MESLHGSAPPLPPAPPSSFATASVRTALASARSGRAWPLRPLAPAIVILVGLAVAAAIGAFGVANLAAASDDHAAARAELLATTLGARLSRLPTSEWLDLMQLAARKTGAEFVVISRDGDVVFDASLGMADRAALKRVAAVSSGRSGDRPRARPLRDRGADRAGTVCGAGAGRVRARAERPRGGAGARAGAGRA